MHSFTIALISTLSLGVHAASIGDSVSQLVTREQHNRLIHNPDFTSANLPAAESFERTGKISPRVVDAIVSGLFNINSNPAPNTQAAVTQAVPNAQTPSVPATATNTQPISAAAIDGNTVDTQATNTQTVTNTQADPAVIIPQSVQAISGVRVAAVDLLATYTVLASLVAQLLASFTVNGQAATISVAVQDAITAQISAQISLTLTKSQVTYNQLDASLSLALQVLANEEARLTAVNAAAPATLSSNLEANAGLSLSLNEGAKRDLQDSQQDVVKRQLPANTTNTTGSLPNLTEAATQDLSQVNKIVIARRGDNTKYSDDQVEDMDFSAHDSEAEEVEEDF